MTASLLSALIAGLAGAGHCAGMCGGIAGAIHLSQARDGNLAVVLASLGRILGYAIAGAAIALPGSLLMGSLLGDVDRVLLTRALTGAMLILVGLALLLPRSPLSALERWGAPIWSRISPKVGRLMARRDPLSLGLVGLAWGFLPCGLVYSILLVAASSGDPLAGASLMVAFGLGTLPAVVASGWMLRRGITRGPWFRRASGLTLVLFGLWTAIAPPLMTLLSHGAH